MNAAVGQTGGMSVGDALVYAERCRNDGRLMEAEAVCRRILTTQQEHPETAHLLGMITANAGDHDGALRLLQQAVSQSPQHPVFHFNLGAIYRHLERLAEIRGRTGNAAPGTP